MVKKEDQSSSLFNSVRLWGVVVGEARAVEGEGRTVNVESITPQGARRPVIEGLSASRLWSEFNGPVAGDIVTVRDPGSGDAVVAFRIDERWAAVVGFSQYESEEIPDPAMRKAMFVFLQQAHREDLVVICDSGHGAPDPNRPGHLYLLPHDADLDRLAATAFPMWDAKTALRRKIAAERVVVIADACQSAGTTEAAIRGSRATQSPAASTPFSPRPGP